nr:endo-beta-1,4-glucanase [uncultured bacterium]
MTSPHASRSVTRAALFTAFLMGLLSCLLGAIVGTTSAAYADESTTADDQSVPVYRLYNHVSSEHLFTVSEGEKQTLEAHPDWRLEGVAFMAPTSGDPVMRLRNIYTGEHFYSKSTAEINNLKNNHWMVENNGDPLFYSAASATTYPVWRLYNAGLGALGRCSHHFTADSNEYSTLAGNPHSGWTGEDVAFYGVGAGYSVSPATPYEAHGALAVANGTLVDQNDQPFQLRGMSTHGLSFNEEGVPFKDYVSYETFRTLRDDWGANCVRLAMYTENYMGYCSGGNQEELKNIIRRGVQAASDLGMYVIVDWHILENGNPTAVEWQASDFFSQMSNEFRNRDNVLYEICNEPNAGTDWWTIKGYAERIIPVIRANDPNAIVIVGTPTWSQDIDQAAANPLQGSSGQNILYALHFYADTHKQWLRDRLNTVLDAGLPVFISEFGTCDSSGNGGYNPWEAQQWIDLANRRNVSWMNWSLCLKNETASAIQPWCKKLSDWETWELTESGNWVRNQMRAAAGLD